MSQKELAKKARKVHGVISKGWTKGTEARDKWGHPVEVHSKSAVKFCLNGAIWKCAASGLLPHVSAWVRNGDIIGFNDDPTTVKEDVLRLLRFVEDELDS